MEYIPTTGGILLPDTGLRVGGKFIGEHVRNGEVIDHYETVRRRKDGTLFPVALTISPVYNEQGIVVGASKIARDVTEPPALLAVT